MPMCLVKKRDLEAKVKKSVWSKVTTCNILGCYIFAVKSVLVVSCDLLKFGQKEREK